MKKAANPTPRVDGPNNTTQEHSASHDGFQVAHKLRRPFAAVEREVLRSPCLSKTAKLVYALLCDHADRNGGHCFPGLARLAKLSRSGKSSVIKAVRELEAAGCIVVTRRRNTQKPREAEVNVYSLVLKSCSTSTGSSTQDYRSPKGDDEGRPIQVLERESVFQPVAATQQTAPPVLEIHRLLTAEGFPVHGVYVRAVSTKLMQAGADLGFLRFAIRKVGERRPTNAGALLLTALGYSDWLDEWRRLEAETAERRARELAARERRKRLRLEEDALLEDRRELSVADVRERFKPLLERLRLSSSGEAAS